MSSILDALKKVEEEKQAAQQAASLNITDEIAERDLLGGTGRARQGDRGMLIMGAASLVAIVLALSAAVAYLVLRINALQPAAPNPAVVSSVVAPEPVTPTVTVPSTPRPSPQPATVTAPAEHEAGAGQASMAAATSPPPTPPPRPARPVEVIAPKANEPAKDDADTPAPKRTEPITTAAYVPPAPIAKSEAKSPNFIEENRPSTVPPDEIRILPIMTEDLKERYGLSNMRINMVSQASDRQPAPCVVINLRKTFLGETIRNSSVRLVGISPDGIAVEVGSTGARFYIPN